MNTGEWSLLWPWPLHFIHHTSSRAFHCDGLFCFKLSISNHRFCSCVWICLTPNPVSCIRVSCNLMTISNTSAWVESFYCDSVVIRCSVKDATNHERCWASMSVILASCIVLFNHWSRSHGVSPGSIATSLNPMIDCVSNFGQINSLFNALWIFAILAFVWSLECLIYHVNVWSCSMHTNVAFLMSLYVTPCASYITLTTN